jgi:dienelactone hydrolase
VYGPVPSPRTESRCVAMVDDCSLHQGEVLLRQVAIELTGGDLAPCTIDLAIYLPLKRGEPVPCFLGLNFFGNHTTTDEPRIRLNPRWMPTGGPGVVDHRATDASRASRMHRWPALEMARRGYAIATFYHGDVALDRADDVHARFSTMSRWAWGLQRALDYLQADRDIDSSRVIAMGHSRNGKAALWAAATDERFLGAVSNQSGCGGAALNNGKQGERIADIARNFPHWFTQHFATYAGRDEEVPVDQHELLACIAPRPVLVTSAAEDRWADPIAEHRSCVLAGEAYAAHDAEPLPTNDYPPVNTLVAGTIGYHVRPGQHDITPADWNVFAEFFDRFV